MSKIQDFAQEKLGIILTDTQLDYIRAWAEGKKIFYARAGGKTTALKVLKAYIKESL